MVEVIPRIKTQILEIPTSLVLFGKLLSKSKIQVQLQGTLRFNMKQRGFKLNHPNS
jgi:hypothetical protein